MIKLGFGDRGERGKGKRGPWQKGTSDGAEETPFVIKGPFYADVGCDAASSDYYYDDAEAWQHNAGLSSTFFMVMTRSSVIWKVAVIITLIRTNVACHSSHTSRSKGGFFFFVDLFSLSFPLFILSGLSLSLSFRQFFHCSDPSAILAHFGRLTPMHICNASIDQLLQ